jgi:hypothetical protein
LEKESGRKNDLARVIRDFNLVFIATAAAAATAATATVSASASSCISILAVSYFYHWLLLLLLLLLWIYLFLNHFYYYFLLLLFFILFKISKESSFSLPRMLSIEAPLEVPLEVAATSNGKRGRKRKIESPRASAVKKSQARGGKSQEPQDSSVMDVHELMQQRGEFAEDESLDTSMESQGGATSDDGVKKFG